jgi:putative ABC transport system permease protein
MILRDGVFLAMRAITAHRMRSGLTLLGIAVGIAAVILLTSIGEGIHRFVLAEFSQFGTNIIGISPGRVKTGGAPPSGLPTAVKLLTFDDARALRKLPNVTAIGPIVYGNAEIAGNGRTRRTTVYGVTEDALQVFNMKVTGGQFLPAEEWESARAFVVLGSTLKNELFGSANALGARLRTGGLQFRVVGVLAP